MSDFVVNIPVQNLAGGGSDIQSRMATWDWKYRLRSDSRRLLIDFTNNYFIEPWALALFTAYALRIKREYGIEVVAKLSNSPSNQYIKQMGLPEVLATGKSTEDWDNSIKNTGLHVLQTHQDVTRFVTSAAQLGLGEANETMDAMKYGMAELGRNVIQHSGSQIGGVAIAQYFTERKAIQISIADAGKGVFKSLSHMYPEIKTNLEGLKLAILPHVSGAFPKGTYSGSENAGLGLFFCKEICWRAGGKFWLMSEGSVLGVVDRDDAGQKRVYRKVNPWHGTLVTMDLPERGVDDFGGMLSYCRRLAAEARKASGPAGLDFLDELPDLEDLIVVSAGNLNEDVQAAVYLRDTQILPALQKGQLVVMDFAGARFVTQSFVHALMNDAFRVAGSLVRLSFINCTESTKEAIAAVAAYAASYSLCIE